MKPSDDRQTANILIVEDNDELANLLSNYLATRGMAATPAGTLPVARDLLRRHRFDAVVLDLNLGDYDGLTLARELADKGGPPVVIASSRVDEADRVLGLEVGADDYLTKPFSFRELLARLKIVIRRSRDSRRRPPARRVAEFGRWTFDTTALRLVDDTGREQRVTGGEIALLRVFLENPERVLLRSQIVSLTKRDDAAVFERAVDVLVGRLRSKIEDDPSHPRLICTVRGEGYRFSAAVNWKSSAD